MAVNTANNLLYLVESGLLGFFLISGLSGHRNLCRLEIKLTAPEEIFAATEYPLHVTILNAKKFMPVFLLRLSIAGSSLLFPYVEPQGSLSTSLPFFFTRRGTYVFKDISTGSIFPFNFIRRRRGMDNKFTVLVFPQPLDLGKEKSGDGDRRFASGRQATRQGQEPEVLSVRDYQAGDAMKYIHWKASARAGELKTKEMAATVPQQMVIDFNDIAIADVERKLSYIAFLILTSLKRNILVGLRISGKYHPPASSKKHRIAMLTELALYNHENKRNKN